MRRQSLTSILKTIQNELEKSNPTFGTLVHRFERRGFGPLLIFPAMLIVLPTGAIPGMPAVCALFIILNCVQIIIGKQKPWLPQKIEDLDLSSDKYPNQIESILPYTRKIDRYIYPRLTFLFNPPMLKILAALCIILALSMIAFSLIPFAAMLPALAILLFSLGIAAFDGLLLLGGFAIMGTCGWVIPFLLNGVNAG